MCGLIRMFPRGTFSVAVTKKRNEPKPPETSPPHTKPPETSPSHPETSPSPFESSGNKSLPTRNQSSSSCGHAVRAFVKVIPILYNSRVFSGPRAPPFLQTGDNVNFQIAVASACLLDIRISFIYTSSCIRLGTKL